MSAIQTKTQLMTGSEIDRTLVRLAHEILEKNESAERLAIVGIHRRGAILAERLSAKIAQIAAATGVVGSVDISLYRDDLSTLGENPIINGTKLPASIEGKDVILVDDVLYTGRTVRSALDALFDHSRPHTVQLCVLIDRGHRELPIEARFVGKYVETSDSEIVEVKVAPIDGDDRVLLAEKVEQD